MSNYQAGNQVECLFAFTNRALSQQEQASFLEGNGLPVGAGVDQITVQMDYVINGGTIHTITGGSIIHDGTGEYHGVVTAVVAGTYTYRGYSLDGESNPVASTGKNSFTVDPFP